ncbi:MAG: monooxygenase FAD-binding [Chitinophagaceae bacterium]|nr:MAG: monooxygenase FAD-binding [Chitinophagaceae bacterium]
MQKEYTLKLKPHEAASTQIIQSYLAQSAGVSPENINGILIIKKSIDARSKQAWINLTVRAFINEPLIPSFQKCTSCCQNSYNYWSRTCWFICSTSINRRRN